MTEAYAIYDTQDRLWFGDVTGVRVFPRKMVLKGKPVDGHEVACAVNTILNEQFGHGWGSGKRVRFRVAPWVEQPVHFHDEVTPPITALEALTQIESCA